MDYRIELAGRNLILRYTVNAMCAVEDACGGALDTMLERQFSAARLLLWGGMLEAQPDATLQDAGAIIGDHLARGGTLEQIVDHCAEGMRRAGFFGKAAQPEKD